MNDSQKILDEFNRQRHRVLEAIMAIDRAASPPREARMDGFGRPWAEAVAGVARDRPHRDSGPHR